MVDIPPSRRMVAAAAVVAAAGMLLFISIAEDLADGGGLISHDQAVLDWFVAHRTPALVTAARVVSAIGGFAGLFVAGLVLAAILFAYGWRQVVAVLPLASLVLASLASSVAKSLFGRDRPPIEVHAATVTLAAFPSGHATDAAAFFLAAGCALSLTVARHRHTRIVLLLVAAAFAVAVGVSRLVLAVHWLSDVVAGWALGSSIATVAVICAWAFDANRRVRGRHLRDG
jgi:undecaprenyl-diphosphatase